MFKQSRRQSFFGFVVVFLLLFALPLDFNLPLSFFLSRLFFFVLFSFFVPLGHGSSSSEQSTDQFFTLFEFFLENCILFKNVFFFFHHVLEEVLHSIDQFVHFGQFFIEAVTFLLCLLDLLFSFLNFVTDSLQFALVLKGLQGTSSLLHDLSEPLVSQQSCNHVAPITQILNPFHVCFHLLLEVFYLTLILSSQFLDGIVELPILILFQMGQLFVFVEKVDLLLEDGFVVGRHCVQETVLATALLRYLMAHLVQVVLRFVYKSVDFALEVVVSLVDLQLSNAVPELVILGLELLCSTCGHSNYIQTY